LIRLLSLLCVLYGINGFIYALILTISQSYQIDGITGAYSLMSGVFYFIWGIILFFLSKPLGKIIGSGLDE
jgi:hypothetical protein